jgi:hypothetical protein
MCAIELRGRQLTPKAEKVRYVFGLWRKYLGLLWFDDIVEAELKSCMRAEGIKNLGEGPCRLT